MILRRGGALARVALALGGVWLAGCSVLLDPENCSDDSECNGGICQDGICVGGDTPDTIAPDTMVDGATPMPDDGVPDGEVDMTIDAEVDAAPEADVLPPDPERPLCMLVSIPRGGEVTAAEEVELTLTVTDPDTDPADLVVMLDGEAVDFDGAPVEQTRALVEGANAFVLTAEDTDGLSCEARIDIVVDRTAPTIDGLTPREGADLLTAEAAFPVSGTVVDAHFSPDGPGQLVVMVNGDPAEAEIEWDGLGFEMEITLLEGANDVEVSALDDLGNASATSAFSVALDITPPEIEVDEPADEISVFVDRIDVVGRVLDGGEEVARGDVSVAVEQAGQRAREFDGLTGNDGRFSREVPLFEGLNTLTITGWDEAGNSTEVVRTVTRLAAEPCVTLTLPPDGTFTGEVAVDVAGDVCPAVDRVEVRVGEGASTEVVPADEAFETVVELPGPGRHTITAVAFAGDESAEDSVQVTLDISAPEIAISEPLGGACTNVETLRVCGQASDAESGVDTLTLSADGAQVAVDLPVGGGPFCDDIDVPEGESVRVVASVRNRAAGVADAAVDLRVDRSAPDVCIVGDDVCLDAQRRVWFGVNGAGQVQLDGRADWGTCGVASLVVDGLPTNVGADGGFAVLRAFDDGPQEIELRAADTAGNTSITPFVFRVDGTPPVLDDVGPGVDTFTTEDEVRIDVTFSDEGSGIVQMMIGGDEVFAEAPGVEQGRRDRSASRAVPVEEGVNTVTIVAVDLVGNRIEETVTIRKDTAPPVVEIVSPQPGRPAPAPTTISGTIDDGPEGSGPASVTVNGVEANVDVETGTWWLTGVELDPDDPEVTVEATDTLGNAVEPPLVQPVTLTTFGTQDPSVDGLDFEGPVGWLGMADLDRDGRLDVIALAAEPDGESAVFMQQDDGRFEAVGPAQAGLPENMAARAAVAGDLDGNGAVDLFIVGVDRTAIALGNGRGGFSLVPNSRVPGVADPIGVVVGDVTRNAFLDFAIMSAGDARLYLSAGDGTFDREPLGNLGIGALGAHRSGWFIDMNRDGVLDLVAIGPMGSSLWFGDRFNQFASAPPESGFVGASAELLLAIDADRDGVLDLFTAGDGDARFMINDGNGTFTEEARGIESWPADLIGAVRVDYDGDTRDDIIGWGPAGIRVWRNAPVRFTATPPLDIGLDPAEPIRSMVAGDLDGDGDDDLLVSGPGGLRLIRSNLAALDESYASLLADVRRAVGPGQGPRDAWGARVDVDLVGGDDGLPERAMLARPNGPTVVTTGEAESIGLAVSFVDLGGVGQSVRSLVDLLPDSLVQVFAREGAN